MGHRRHYKLRERVTLIQQQIRPHSGQETADRLRTLEHHVRCAGKHAQLSNEGSIIEAMKHLSRMEMVRSCPAGHYEVQDSNLPMSDELSCDLECQQRAHAVLEVRHAGATALAQCPHHVLDDRFDSADEGLVAARVPARKLDCGELHPITQLRRPG